MGLINFIERHPLYACFIIVNIWLVIHVIRELVYKKDDEDDQDDDSDDGIDNEDDPVIDLPPGITLPDEPEEVLLR